MTSSILTLDFGGTKVAAAVITLGKRQLRSHCRVLLHPNTSAITDLKIVCTLKRELLQVEQIAAMGVSFGGKCDRSI